MCDKISFATSKEAQRVLNAAKRSFHNRKKTIPKRYYKCKVCGNYHLTSQGKYKEQY